MSVGYFLLELLEAVIIFALMSPLIAVAIPGLLVIAWKFNWTWLLVSTLTLYGGLAIHWVLVSRRLPELNLPSQIYAVSFIWGALTYISLVVLLSFAIRAWRGQTKQN